MGEHADSHAKSHTLMDGGNSVILACRCEVIGDRNGEVSGEWLVVRPVRERGRGCARAALGRERNTSFFFVAIIEVGWLCHVCSN